MRRMYPGHVGYYIGDTKGDMIEARKEGAVPIAAGWDRHDAARLAQANPRRILSDVEALLNMFADNPAIPPG